MTRPSIELRGITKRFGPTTALRGVDLAVPPGEVHALMGENGAGKSTLLKVVSGAVSPDRGEMALAGEPVDLGSLTPASARRLGVAIVHQEFSLIPSMTVAENIFLGREVRRGMGLDRRSMRDQTRRLLERVSCGVRPETVVETLSVADAQLVEIAKALVGDIRVLAMDEPSAVLSGAELTNLFAIVRALADDGVAVLYVSHRLDEVFRLCERYTVLKDGAVAATGAIRETTPDDLVDTMVGRSVSQVFPAPAAARGEVRLRLRDFSVEGLAAPVDLEAHAGEIVGLAGLQGSGRTRLAKGIFGAVPARGRVEIDGRGRRPFHRPAEAIAAGIAYLPEDRKEEGLALDKSVAVNGSLLALSRLRNRIGLLADSAEREMADDMRSRLSIKTAPGGRDLVRSLSGGNQQKVVLGKWLTQRPRVLVFDEPTRGIDVGAKEQIYRILRELADDGVAILFISSELIEVLGLADRILVMAGGRLVGELPGHVSTEEDVMRLASSHRPTTAAAAP
ncbi:MAG TPA: sugar ABC transporter ATP-binding protein [Geodermatophilus sp.]|nr:sugar ABC transporter ATP-binding protein [Geodermatophilus sp.]